MKVFPALDVLTGSLKIHGKYHCLYLRRICRTVTMFHLQELLGESHLRSNRGCVQETAEYGFLNTLLALHCYPILPMLVHVGRGLV